jgi:hypothetical protein
VLFGDAAKIFCRGLIVSACARQRTRRRAFPPLPESHIMGFSAWHDATSPNSTAVCADSSGLGTHGVDGFGWGDRAMWIIWYIGMMASLRAMGLAPSLVPIRTDEDRKPFGDM